MNPRIGVAVLFLACTSAQVCAGEKTICPGNDIREARKAMAEAGYKETGLAMLATKADTDLQMWSVGEGVLILTYSTKDNKVLGMSYFLCDERPKATRRTFDLDVKEFDPKTRELRITLPNKAPEDTARKLAEPQG
jgi:hypothetical protein